MPSDFPRSRRVAEQIRHELADILWREVQDPSVKGVTLTAVEVSSDLEHAKVWYTLLTGDAKEASRGLERATGFLRRELSRRMRLRAVPGLSFLYDESVERGVRLSHLIDEAVEEDRRHHQDDPGDTDG